MTLRRLTRDDAAAWKAFRIEMLTEVPRAFGASLKDTVARPVEAFADWIDKSAIFVVDEGGFVASAAWYADGDPMTAHRAHMVSVYVQPSERGRGLFDQLITHVVEDARQAGKIQIELDVAADNTVAIRAYERHGFERTGFIPRAFRHGDQYTDDIQMMRAL